MYWHSNQILLQQEDASQGSQCSMEHTKGKSPYDQKAGYGPGNSRLSTSNKVATAKKTASESEPLCLLGPQETSENQLVSWSESRKTWIKQHFVSNLNFQCAWPSGTTPSRAPSSMIVASKPQGSCESHKLVGNELFWSFFRIHQETIFIWWWVNLMKAGKLWCGERQEVNSKNRKKWEVLTLSCVH